MSLSFDFPWRKGRSPVTGQELTQLNTEKGDSYLTEVLINLWMKKWLLDAGDPRHEQKRLALMILSGGQAGAWGAGRLRVLEEFGFAHVFDIIGGVSVGALLAAYLLSGQLREASHLFFLICKKEGAIYLNPLGLCVNVRGLIEDHIRPHMDLEKVRRSRTKFFVGVTDVTNPRKPTARILDAKNPDEGHDTPEYIQASMTVMPFESPVRLRDRFYCDGIASNPFPIDLLKGVGTSPTHVLVITNGPEGDWWGIPLIKWVLATASLMRHSKEIRAGFAHYHNKAKRQINHVHEDDRCIVGIAYDEGSITAVTRNLKRLKAAMDQSEADMRKKLEYARTLAEIEYAQMFA